MFKKEFLPLILSGRKTQTRRSHRRLLRVGQTYSVQVNWTRSTGYSIRILDRYYQKLGEVSEAEANKEGFNSLEELKEAWIKITGQWNLNQEIVAYEFKITKSLKTTTF
jgi:hypothetical protein